MQTSKYKRRRAHIRLSYVSCFIHCIRVARISWLKSVNQIHQKASSKLDSNHRFTAFDTFTINPFAIFFLVAFQKLKMFLVIFSLKFENLHRINLNQKQKLKNQVYIQKIKNIYLQVLLLNFTNKE